MELFLLSAFNSLANNYIAELRDIDIQKDSMRFRQNMERIGEILAYEISRNLEYEKIEIKTSLGSSNISVINAILIFSYYRGVISLALLDML